MFCMGISCLLCALLLRMRRLSPRTSSQRRRWLGDRCEPASILAVFNNGDPGTIVAVDVRQMRCIVSWGPP